MATAEDTMEYSEEEANTYFSDEKTHRHVAEESRLVQINTSVSTVRTTTNSSHVFCQRELQTLRYVWFSCVPQKHIPKSPNKDMGIIKWIRGHTRLQLQPTDDLLGGETLGTVVLSHPLSPNIMEHDLQPQSGLSQRAATPLRPCPDSQVWTDISDAVSRKISQGCQCQGGRARMKPGCPTVCVIEKGGWTDWVIECWPQLTPQGHKKALTRKVRVSNAAVHPLSCLQGGWYNVESSAGIQQKTHEEARIVWDLYGLSAQSQGEKGHCSSDLQQPVSLSSPPGELRVEERDRGKEHVFLLLVLTANPQFTCGNEMTGERSAKGRNLLTYL